MFCFVFFFSGHVFKTLTKCNPINSYLGLLVQGQYCRWGLSLFHFSCQHSLRLPEQELVKKISLVSSGSQLSKQPKCFFWKLDTTWSHSRTEDCRSGKAPVSPAFRWIAVKHRGQRLALSRDADATHPFLRGFSHTDQKALLSTFSPSFLYPLSIAPGSIPLLASCVLARGTQAQTKQPCYFPVCLTV